MSVPCKAATFDGPIGRYVSSEGCERGFCTNCGSSLFFHASGTPIHAISIALFDDQSGLPFCAEIYIDDKPDYYAFSNETKEMTGAEFESRFRRG